LSREKKRKKKKWESSFISETKRGGRVSFERGEKASSPRGRRAKKTGAKTMIDIKKAIYNRK